jgi:SAM-dependent methyltransferase
VQVTTWWAELYDDLLAEVLLVRGDPADTARTLSYLISQLRLEPGSRVLDQCCGIGSLALPLAQAGYQVVGVDQAKGYVARARGEASRAGLSVELHAADAFEFVARPPCRAVLNWWTSFGYATDDETNLQMLLRAFESLEPGGRLALDVMNLPGVLRNFAPTVTLRRQTAHGEVELARESELDLARGELRKLWRYTLPDGRRVEHVSTVRLYMPHSLAELVRRAGFVDVVLHGELDASPLGLDSRRCILVATRP